MMPDEPDISTDTYANAGQAAFNRRAPVLMAMVMIGLAFLVLVLINLQLFHGAKYRKLAVTNATWRVPETPVEERARDATIAHKP